MPCNDGGPLHDYETHHLNRHTAKPRLRSVPSAAEKKLTGRIDALARENDMLRETILQLVNSRDYKIPVEVVDIVEKAQIAHRKVDLERLEQIFRLAKNPEMLGRVILADPTVSLETQLGFNPDDY